MAHVTTDIDTTVPPDRVLAALHDFGPGRFDLFPNINKDFFSIQEEHETSADVIEGSPSVWEQGHYDWSVPGQLRIEVTDSNAFANGSWWLYQVTPRPDGGSHVHMEFDRRPKNFKGKMISALFNLTGNALPTRWLGQTLHRLEQMS